MNVGYVECRNLVIEYRYAEGKVEQLPELAAELVALKVQIIVAPPTPAAQAAKQATKTIPIVFAGVGDPVASRARRQPRAAGRQCHRVVRPWPRS